jgi:hypothetical protein
MMRRAPLPVLLLTLLTLNTLPAGQAAPPLRLIVEAEDFQPTAGDWAAKDWGTNYYAATFAISFLSRGRYLSAPEQGAPSAAEKEIDVPRDGTFEVWARFEQPYNYAVEFDVEIRQGGQTVFQRGYGRLDAPKLWPFKKGLQPQVLWEWGGTDNIVWEGKDTKAALKKGKATLVLKKGPQKAAQAARRNVDAILLTDDAAGVEKQIKQASYLPLDGWFTQAGDVFLKVTNPADAAAPLAAHVGPCTEHSPYWVHVRDWPHQIWIGKTEGAEAPKPDGYLKPGAASPWVEVGRFLDTLNQSQWRVFPVAADKQPLAGKKVHLALGLAGPDGQPRVLREGDFTVGTDGAVTFFLDGDLRRTRRVRTVEEDLEQLARVVQAFPKKGKRPEQFLIDGIMGSASGVEQSPRVKELCRDIALALGSNTLPEVPRPERNASIDVRSIPTKDLAAYCQKLVKEGKADRLKVVSLGDEIHIGGEAQSPRDDPAFRAYLRERNADPADLGLKTLDEARLELKDKQSLLYYASQVFSFEQGLKAYKERTDVLEANLPKGIYCGANYSPHPYYWPREGQWIRAFARRALTLPWAEDYTWQIPEASQQINGYLLTALRAAAKYHDLPIQMYVMPHAPGQTPADLRRAWYTALGHGAKQLNFFCATPLSVAYTENYVVSEAADTWRTIHDLVHETGQAEEVLFPAQPRPAEVGLLISFAQDLWDP